MLKIGILIHSLWECKMAEPIWKTIWDLFLKLSNNLPSYQTRSVAQLCPTLCDPMNRSTPGLPVHHQLPEFTQTQRPSSWWCHPAISSSVVPFSCCPPIPPSIRVFSSESTLCMRWPKYWSFSFSIMPSKEIPELISFRMDWLDLKSLLQHHSSKASILRHSAFFTVQLSHPYMTTGKTIALTRQTETPKWKKSFQILENPKN